MKTMRFIRPVLFLATLGIALSACTQPASYDVEGTDEPSATAPAADNKPVQVKKLVGDGVPRDTSIVCVRGSAFLYVYTDGGNDGGPAIARFPEQDDTCAT
jgi:hypothetical protein